MIRSGLHNGHFVLRPQTQERKRYADVVVEVTAGAEHIVFLAEHGRHEFLRRGLSVGTGHLNHGRGKPAAVMRRQLLQRGQHIGHVDEALVSAYGRVVHHGVGTARLKRLEGEVVAVERGAAQGEKYGTFRTVARVGRHDGVLPVQFVEFVDSHSTSHLLCCHISTQK